MDPKESRLELERREAEYFQSEYAKDPSLFETPTLREDAEFLRNFGIHVPGKDTYADGYYKLYPQDSIVEEVRPDGNICTIEPETSRDDVAESPTGIYEAILVKCNLSTLEAVDELARAFRCDKAKIGYAGIKDKDAITAQRISFSGIPLREILSFEHPHMFLKSVAPAEAPVRKGILSGNKFTIYVRTSPEFFDPAHSAQFVENVAKTNKDGFYNFYYLQRFGAPRFNNFPVGLDLLRGDYEGALRRIITEPGDNEWPFIRDVRETLAAAWGDWAAVLAIMEPMPIFFREERKMVGKLAETGDPRAALALAQDKVGIISYSVASLFFNEYIAGRLESGQAVPRELPLLFSPDKRDIDVYKDFLSALGLYPLSFRNVLPFRSVRLDRRMVPTKGTAKIGGTNVTEHGVVLSFTLGKGEYATTFMCHFFNMVSGTPPEFVDRDEVDVKALAGEGSVTGAVGRFRDVIRPKEGIFGKGIGQE